MQQQHLHLSRMATMSKSLKLLPAPEPPAQTRQADEGRSGQHDDAGLFFDSGSGDACEGLLLPPSAEASDPDILPFALDSVGDVLSVMGAPGLLQDCAVGDDECCVPPPLSQLIPSTISSLGE